MTKKIQFDLIIKLNRKMLSNSSPNILILVENEIKFKEIKSYLKHILGSNAYTIYKISKQELTKPLWMKNCQLLIQLDFYSNQIIMDYLKEGGKLLAITLDQNEIYSLEDIYQNKMNLTKTFMLNESVHVYNVDLGFHFISNLMPSLENRNLFEILFQDKIGLKMQIDASSISDEKFQLFTQNRLLQSVSVVQDYLKSHLSNETNVTFGTGLEFDEKIYFEYLSKTNRFGTILMYTNLIGSTMNTFSSLPNSIDNLIVVARQQNQGLGIYELK